MVKRKRPLAAGILGGAVVLWVIIGLLFPTGTIALGVGHTNVQISFVVVDADTGQPVGGAAIHLRDPDLADIPAIPVRDPDLTRCPGRPPVNIDLDTAADGSASVWLGLQFVDSWETGSGRLLSFHVRYPQWNMRVGCEGYQEFTAPFAAYERENPRFHDGYAPPPKKPPPIVIRLRRHGPASRARLKM
jgi:hypothetical protein